MGLCMGCDQEIPEKKKVTPVAFTGFQHSEQPTPVIPVSYSAACKEYGQETRQSEPLPHHAKDMTYKEQVELDKREKERLRDSKEYELYFRKEKGCGKYSY